jgi:2-dehydropantoate 2-reductase
MKVAIVGCGAMGSIYAALLASAGNEITVVDSWQAHVDAIQTNGLRVEGASGDRIVKVQACIEPPDRKADLVIIAAKASQVKQAAVNAKRLLGPDTAVLTIQNGLGSADVAAGVVGGDRLVVGIASAFGASLRGPGHAHHNGMAAIRMGAYAGLAHGRVEAIAALWRGAGFTADAVENVAAIQWEKLICNVAFSGPCALANMTVGQAMDDVDMGPLGMAAATEAWQVARARKVPISVTDPESYVRAFGERVRKARPSVLLDHDVRRRSEIDVINGAVAREAAQCAMAAPVNATLTALVKQRESSF